jgi:hypothetical protein
LKAKRNKGEEYITTKGKTRPARAIRFIDCKCRFKCAETISKECQQSMFDSYWGLGNYERQRQFLLEQIQTTEPQRHGQNIRKQSTNRYYITLKNEKTRVCQRFFLATLGIGKKTIEYAVRKRSIHGGFHGTDQRGRHAAWNTIKPDDIKRVKSHIESFPRMESHYSRKDSKKEYLALDLNITRMYDLYVLKCKEDGVTPVKSSKYRQIFCENYNLCFF